MDAALTGVTIRGHVPGDDLVMRMTMRGELALVLALLLPGVTAAQEKATEVSGLKKAARAVQ